MSVTMLRWTIVDGCVRWLRITAPRWIAPVARGLPSLGPCAKVAAIAVPLAGVGAFYGPFAPARPYYGYPLASQAPVPAWAQGYATGAGSAGHAGEWNVMPGGVPVVSGPGAFAASGGGYVVERGNCSLLHDDGHDLGQPNEHVVGRGERVIGDLAPAGSLPALTPPVINAPPPDLTLPPVEHSSGPPPTSVPEPASLAVLIVGIGAALTLRKRVWRGCPRAVIGCRCGAQYCENRA